MCRRRNHVKPVQVNTELVEDLVCNTRVDESVTKDVDDRNQDPEEVRKHGFKPEQECDIEPEQECDIVL